MSERTWSDQPEELEACEVICSFQLERRGDTHHVEVRQAPDGFYLTFGNLFGSQTVHAEDGLAAFLTINNAGKSTKLPPRAKLMSEPRKAEV